MKKNDISRGCLANEQAAHEKNAAVETESGLRALRIGVGVFKLHDNLLTPVSFSGAFYSILGYTDGECPDIHLSNILSGQSNFERSEILTGVRLGGFVELTTDIKDKNGESFCARILLKLKTAPNIYDVGIIRLSGITVISSEPYEKSIKNSGAKTTAAEEYTRSWHDKRYRLLLEDSSVITFDYDAENDLLSTFQTDEKNNLIEVKQPKFIKNTKSNKTSRLSPAVIMAENFEKMFASPSVCEFDVHESNDKFGYRWYRCKCKSIAAQDGKVRHIIGRMDDITTNKSEQAQLHALAEKDGLTGILNRAAMERFFDDYFKKSALERVGMLFFIDFDKFKYINDTYGHLAGDQLLRESAKAISKVLRSGDLFCRYGGDEFVIFIDGMTEVSAAERKAERIIDAVAAVRIGENIKVNCSLGIASLQITDQTANAAIKRADTALLHAKKFSIGSFVYHDGNGSGSAKVVRRSRGKKEIVVEESGMPDDDLFVDDKGKAFDIAIGTFNTGVFYYYPDAKNIGVKNPEKAAGKEKKFSLESFLMPLLDKKSFLEVKKQFTLIDEGKKSVEFTVELDGGDKRRISAILVNGADWLPPYAVCLISRI